jgi:hypothetical protein
LGDLARRRLVTDACVHDLPVNNPNLVSGKGRFRLKLSGSGSLSLPETTSSCDIA